MTDLAPRMTPPHAQTSVRGKHQIGAGLRR
jgi:hypothetical protein